MQVKTFGSRKRATAFRATLSIAAATALLLTAVTASEAKSRTNWRNANASIHHSSAGGLSGKASWYGPGFAGRKTASGARFNPMGMTAAHRTLPFGTKLRVSHGGRSVVDTVNDRGPFIRGRVLDLSQGAARALGIGGVGHVVAQVEGRGGSRTFADAGAE